MGTLATFPIPATTLNGAQTFGPASVPLGATWARVSIDRTAGAQSLNSQPGANLRVDVDESADGATWSNSVIDFATVGGIVIVRGVQQNTSFFQAGLIGDPASTTRQVRATVTTDRPISIAGSITLGN